MTDLVLEPACHLASLMQDRKISPVELMEAFLRRVDELNPTLNAVVTIAPDAMDKAKEAEASVMRGSALGPLHGLPITIKDTIETGGLRTTSGSPMRADFVPACDAPSVALLKGAGAIVLGKTNPAEMAMDYTADNPVFGRTIHPLDSSLTPGGSSGGEAVAIFSGMSCCGLGSDLAGSIRVPAHLCGIAGLKPTVGSVPGEGQFPPSAGPYSLGAVIGPMARNVGDLNLLFDVLSGPRRPPHASSRPTASRVAWYTDDGVSTVTTETANATQNAVRALANAGFAVEQTRPPGIERGHEFWLKLFSRASVVQLRNVYAGHEDLGGDFVRWRLTTADERPTPTLDEYIGFWLERDRLRATLVDWMKDVPLVVAPVGATPAYPHDTLKVMVGDNTMSTFRAFSYCQTFNVFDLPVVVVQAGRSSTGLPIGVQIIGSPFAEKTVLSAATIVEEALSTN
jgi:Asp-tRNA(Asn)/Glu-tRNA(Gln) amidotransferase A subunit family amidase